MKAKHDLRPAAALLALAALLAAPPSEAFLGLGCRGNGCVARDQVKKRAGKEFKELKDEIKTDHKGEPSLSLYLDHIEGTEKRFNSQADAVLKKERYANWEFEYLKGQVTEVIIPTIKAAVDNAAALPAADRPALLNSGGEKGTHLNAAFRANFVLAHGAEIVASAEADPNPKPQVGGPVTGQIDQTQDPLGENKERGGANPNGPPWGGGGRPKLTPEQVLERSEVVRLAVDSAKYVLNPTEPTPNPNPNPNPNPGGGSSGHGGGGTTTNPSGGGAGGLNGGPSSGGVGDDLIRTISSPSGVSQMYASQGVNALQSRDYASAYDMARRALELDANNRNAVEVLHAAKGRGEGVLAGDTAWGAAKGGAASFGGGPGDPGAFGAASPSPAISAAAAAGAARLAGAQAENAAKGAMRLGDAQAALDILNKALSQNPGNPALLNLRAQTYGHLGRWEEALKDAAAGLALAPGSMPLLNTLARAQNRTHRYKEALATSERMIAADPRGAWGYANRAHARGGLGDKAAMMADIEMAARLDPSFQRAAAEAAQLQLPSDADVLFLFPGEVGPRAAPAASPAAAGRGRNFGIVVGAGIVGGLLLALGLLSTVLAPLKNTVVSVFTKTKRTGPATQAVATAQPASVGGNVGGLIRGQYEISRQIGQGGMGTVYEGTDRSLGRRVAIKKMRDELRVNARERDRFVIEAKTVASLHHPNIVDIYAIAEEGDDVYLVFEYVDGKTVHDLVQSQGRLSLSDSTRVTRAMGEALAYAHSRGVIHRDMKPSNVMLTSAGQVKVMDFGIARMAKDALTRYSMTNTVVGTPPYMAPEQEQGVVRKESDVYSLAVCAYEMLTGKMPFIGIGAGMLMNKINMSYIPPSRAIAGLPETLDEVFLKAFQADPDQRYRAPLEFVAALEAAAGGARSKTA